MPASFAARVDRAEEELRKRHGGARLLFAEDNKPNREVALELLHGAGLAVDTAANGLEAVNKAAALAYDLILMDLHMPRMDGLEATRRIRELPGGEQMAILAMTASDLVDVQAQCVQAGMDEVAVKAAEAEALLVTILKWLSRLRR